MTYFKLNEMDLSPLINEFTITDNVNYNAQTNANGNTVVDYINKKRVFKVGIIPLNQLLMSMLKTELNKFSVKVSYLDPDTKELVENVECIIASSDISYYTIQINNVSFKAVNLQFSEL